jgi:hypothetical protein
MKKLRLNKETLLPLGQNAAHLNQIQAGAKIIGLTVFPECGTGCGCATGYTCGIVCNQNTVNVCDM